MESVYGISGGGAIGGEVDGDSGVDGSTDAKLAESVAPPRPKITRSVNGEGIIIAAGGNYFKSKAKNWVGGGGAIGGEVDGDSGTSVAATCIRAGFGADAELAKIITSPYPEVARGVEGERVIIAGGNLDNIPGNYEVGTSYSDSLTARDGAGIWGDTSDRWSVIESCGASQNKMHNLEDGDGKDGSRN